MAKKREGTKFNLFIFEQVGPRKVKKMKINDGDLFKEWGEVDRIIYQSFGINLPKNLLEPIGFEKKKRKKRG